MFDTRS